MLYDDKDLFFIERLILWGKVNFRIFPWRKQGITVFESLIAELLLRKTSSIQVINIYQDFINRFSGPEELLVASDYDIIELIKPLGLYKQRVRVLKDIASILINQGLPRSLIELKKLPHVGNYIANAVSCFCLGERVAIIDTNIIRIISKFYGLSGSTDARRNKDVVLIAKDLLPIENFVDYNYALLDFGALVCTGRSKPKCDLCVIRAKCDYQGNKA